MRELVDCSIRAAEGEGKERTFLLSFSSEEPYQRYFGPEILDHSEGCVDLERINSIGCMLYNHDRDEVIGRIEKAWVEGGRGYAEVTFDDDADSEKIYQKVKSGTLKGVSVGYMVDSWEEVMPGKQSADGRFTGPCSIARRWAPYEISIVSVPADPTVGVGRSLDGGGVNDINETYARQLQYNKNVTKIGGKDMTKEQMIARQQELLELAKSQNRAMNADEQREFDALQVRIDAMSGAATVEQPGHVSQTREEDDKETRAEDQAQSLDRALREERERTRAIEEMCEHFGVESRQYVDNGSSVDAVRTAIMDQLMREKAPINTGVSVTDDAGDKFRRAASDALLMRSGMTLERPEDGSRELRGMSLRDMAIECLQMDGASEGQLNRRNSDELYSLLARGFYNPEAAFPAILDQTIEKAYKEGHRKVSVTFDRFTKKGSLADFKTHDNYYIAGPVGEFLEVPENGELKHDVFKDDKLPQRKLKTYGRQFTLTRKAFIDDDISLVTSIPARYAASARKTINKQVYQILVNNPAIYDGAQLFSSAHKNLVATGTGVTQEAVQTMIMALANQRDQFDEAIIINPSKIVVPSGLKFDMYTLFYSPTINTSGNTQAVNPLYQYRDSLEVIEDPTINALCGGMGNVMPWWIIGAEGDTDFIEVDYLNGQEIPNIRRMEAPGQLGFIWDIYLDWGVSVMDFRGAVKNPGVAVNTKLALA